MFDKTYELPMSNEYVRHWGLLEAVRELLQNAIDHESGLEFAFMGDSLFITSKGVRLQPETLILGNTSKATDEASIGQFGEGYKIALLVLTRCGYPVTVHNGAVDWIPEFRKSKQFNARVLTIVESKAQEPDDNLTFRISGLNDGDIADIKDTCLGMQDTAEVGEFYENHMGRILLEKPGLLYVNGLFICNTEMKYGYDFNPRFMKLERDRQTVSGWDLQNATKSIWFNTERYDEVAELIEAKIPDMNNADWGTPDLVKDACYRRFIAEHPGHVVATSQEELDKLVDQGLTKVVVMDRLYGGIIRSSSGYQNNEAKTVKAAKTPHEDMEEFFKANRQYMRTKAIVGFKKLLKDSEKWRVK